MSVFTICEVHSCDRPSDGWFVCPTCATTFTQTLAETPWMLDELDTVIAQQTRYVDQSSGKSAETPMMFDVKASETRGSLVNEIETAARMIAEANQWAPKYKTPAGCAIWLERSISAIRLHPAGGDMVSGISAWFAASMWLIDRPAQRQFLGDCAVDPDGQACGGRIYGKAGKPEARCDTCGGIYRADQVRERLLKDLDDRLCTPSEIAHLSTYLGLSANREQVRKRINQWASRGRIAANAQRDENGDELDPDVKRYKFGKVYEMLCQDDTTRRSA